MSYDPDEEGNGFEEVQFTPTSGSFENGEWHAEGSEDFEGKKVNAVCIN